MLALHADQEESKKILQHNHAEVEANATLKGAFAGYLAALTAEPTFEFSGQVLACMCLADAIAKPRSQDAELVQQITALYKFLASVHQAKKDLLRNAIEKLDKLLKAGAYRQTD